jgi:outer membrane protein TolC
VLIARLRVDQSLADFEGSVRNVVSDVEKAYWNLYYAYRQLDTAIAGRDAGLESWRKVHARMVAGAADGSAREEAQARQQYFVFDSVVQQSLNALFTTEGALRYMLGLSASDGRLIRTADEPTTAKVDFDWYDAHSEALVRSVELRKQKWVVKQRELEMIAAKNYLLPQLDAVAQYRWNGAGNSLIDSSNGPQPNAFGSMLGGDFPNWQLGFNFSLPFGFRKENAGVRNAELTLVKERKVLQDMELELSHLLQNAFRELSVQYRLSQTQYDRWAAAQRETKDAAALYDAGKVTLDFVLDAQRRLADSESSFYRAVVDYNLAIAGLHYRKGSLLEYDSVYLAEGPWPAKAYFDAERRARARDAAHYIDYGFTMPKVLSEGPYEQQAGTVGTAGAGTPNPAPGSQSPSSPAPAAPETIKTPAPAEAPGTLPPAPKSPQAKARGIDLGELLTGDSPAVSRRGGFDIGSFNLAGPAEKSENAVQPAAFLQTAPPSAPQAANGWVSIGGTAPPTAGPPLVAPSVGSGWTPKR